MPGKKSAKKPLYILQLYVTGMSPKSIAAIENIKRICEKYIKELYQLEIIDLYKRPEAAAEQHIVFSPTLVKQFPLPRRTIVGTFPDKEKTLNILGIEPNDYEA